MFRYPSFEQLEPEILAFTETRLNKNSVCNVDQLYHTDSPASAGGAAIYITKTLKSIPRPDIKFNMQVVESCWVEIDPCITSVQSEFTCIFIHLFLFTLVLSIYYFLW